MRLDPEKVERWDIYPSIDDKDYFFAERVGSEIHRSPNAREFVPATEYDQLLALYRAAMCSIERLLEARFRRVAMSASELQELVEGEMEKSRDELEP